MMQYELHQPLTVCMGKIVLQNQFTNNIGLVKEKCARLGVWAKGDIIKPN